MLSTRLRRLIAAIIEKMLVVGLFYAMIGFVLFIVIPQGNVVATCLAKLRQVEAK
jgi:hypothetical protein